MKHKKLPRTNAYLENTSRFSNEIKGCKHAKAIKSKKVYKDSYTKAYEYLKEIMDYNYDNKE